MESAPVCHQRIPRAQVTKRSPLGPQALGEQERLRTAWSALVVRAYKFASQNLEMPSELSCLTHLKCIF